MRLYLDLCCFNRPFDDQSQLLVRLQTEAKLAVQNSIRGGTHTLIQVLDPVDFIRETEAADE